MPDTPHKKAPNMSKNNSPRNHPQGQNSDFTSHFDIHVTPDLTWVILSYARFVRLHMCDDCEALDGALAFAWRLGAWRFSPAELATLQDWIAATLTTAIGAV